MINISDYITTNIPDVINDIIKEYMYPKIKNLYMIDNNRLDISEIDNKYEKSIYFGFYIELSDGSVIRLYQEDLCSCYEEYNSFLLTQSDNKEFLYSILDLSEKTVDFKFLSKNTTDFRDLEKYLNENIIGQYILDIKYLDGTISNTEHIRFLKQRYEYEYCQIDIKLSNNITLKLVTYNSHNGYYPHEMIAESTSFVNSFCISGEI